ncbi:MAG: hypothetical protein HQM09_09550 [Candidatus Riflebacteria bacterium]|nr:hypothetical protein [Candidatus Riflebacteria bacterium]
MTHIDSELKLFVFQVSGIKFGADTEQILELIDLETAETEGVSVQWFHEMIPFREKNIIYKFPRVVILKGNEASGIIIDTPDDIFPVESSEIQPLPRLLEATIRNSFIRGEVMIKDQMVLLVDFHKTVDCTSNSGGKIKQ